jgi:hypothetical protein
VGHPSPSPAEWRAALTRSRSLSQTMRAVADYVARRPVAGTPGQYRCNMVDAAGVLRISDRTVRRAVDALVTQGYLSRVARGIRGRHATLLELSLPDPRQPDKMSC